MKLTRIVLTLVLIPTFALMAVCVCACPNAQASVSNELAFHKQTSCCCPENDHHCKNEITTVQKDVAAGTESFQLNQTLDSTFFNVSDSLVLDGNFSSHISALPADFSPPGILFISTTVLRI